MTNDIEQISDEAIYAAARRASDLYLLISVAVAGLLLLGVFLTFALASTPAANGGQDVTTCIATPTHADCRSAVTR